MTKSIHVKTENVKSTPPPPAGEIARLMLAGWTRSEIAARTGIKTSRIQAIADARRAGGAP